MDVRDQLRAALADALTAAGVDPVPAEIVLERPANPEHGDWSSNVALGIGQDGGPQSPRARASSWSITCRPAPPPHVTAVEIAGPGFVNFRLADTWLHDVLVDVVDAGVDGLRPARPRRRAPGQRRVRVGQPQPAAPRRSRPLARPTAIRSPASSSGAATEVTREFYINDRGVQMSSVRRVARRPQARGGAAGGRLPRRVRDGVGGRDARRLPTRVEWGLRAGARDQIEVARRRSRSDFDDWASARSRWSSRAPSSESARATCASPATPSTRPTGRTWLRTHRLRRRQGPRARSSPTASPPTSLPDIAYHRDKFARGRSGSSTCWGADHHGYVPRMKAAMQLLGHDRRRATRSPIAQIVNLDARRRAEVRAVEARPATSSRSSDVIDRGRPRRRPAHLPAAVDRHHARPSTSTSSRRRVAARTPSSTCSTPTPGSTRSPRKADRARASPGVPLAEVDLSLLDPRARARHRCASLSELPDVVRSRAPTIRAPHQITTWARELAAALHGFYHDCYVMRRRRRRAELTPGPDRGWSRRPGSGCAIALDLLGVSAPESM